MFALFTQVTCFYLCFQPEAFASDVGGILGLWLGFSVLTIFEFGELFVDCLVLLIVWIKTHCRKNPNVTQVPPAKEINTMHNENNDTNKGTILRPPLRELPGNGNQSETHHYTGNNSNCDDAQVSNKNGHCSETNQHNKNSMTVCHGETSSNPDGKGSGPHSPPPPYSSRRSCYKLRSASHTSIPPPYSSNDNKHHHQLSFV